MSEGRTLLIVEDDAETRDLYREMFEILSWRIVATGSGVEALALVRMYTFDAVVCDQYARGMNGDELVREILDERLIDSRKIIVVGNGARPTNLPVDVRFVQKPIEPRMMSTLLGRFVAAIPLITVYICGNGQQSLEAIQFLRDVVRGHDVDVEVIDLLADDPKASTRQVSFSPSFIVRFKEFKWSFAGSLHAIANLILACIEYLEEREKSAP